MSNLRKLLIKFMSGDDYRPMNKSELSRSLGLHSSEQRDFRKMLTKLEREGKVTIGAKRRYKLREQAMIQLSGKLRYQHNGNAWFFPDQADEQNVASGMDLKRYDRIFVDQRDMNVALDGDKVVVKITRIGPPRWKREEERHDRRSGSKGGKGGKKDFRGGKNQGKDDSRSDEAAGRVVKILERSQARIIGTYREDGRFCYVEPEEKTLGGVDLLETLDAKPGQLVAVEVVEWKNQNTAPVGKVVQVLGFPESPGVDIISVIHTLLI